MTFVSDLQSLRSPLTFIRNLIDEETTTILKDYESWWRAESMSISEAVDRAGTPHLRMFDQFGTRTDEILFPSDYWKMLKRGYETGALWRAFEGNSLRMHYLIDYVTCFFDAGLGCPYIVSLSTAVPIKKYGAPGLRDKFLPHLLQRDGTNWQGATWMTEVKGASDLGANVETVARRADRGSSPTNRGPHAGSPRGVFDSEGVNNAVSDRWLLNGDKYFASNVGAELAIVAARPDGAPRTVQGLALFLVPRFRADGARNYFIRRLKPKIGTRSVPTGEVELRDSEGYLLGKAEWGIYLILESLNLSRVGNIVGSVALAQRALADALTFAETRVAFGKPIIQHPLMRRQFEERFTQLRQARALMWKAIDR